MTDVMIEARGLGKRYGTTEALREVTFQVRKGEVVGFLGPNGAGKTTTMKILTCFIAPTEGTAKVHGCDVFEDPLGVRRALGYLPESTPLYSDMLVIEYLEFVATMRRLVKDVRRARIRQVVEQTGLGDVIGKEIRALSKGYRQRVGLAQALIHEPPVLILDEPMSGLDPNQAVEIRDVIREIGRERTVILSTHNLAEVQVTCGRVLIIARGQIVADDRPEDLQARAGKSRFAVTLLDERRDRSGLEKRVQEVFSKIPDVDWVRPRRDSLEGELTVDVVPSEETDLRPAIFRAAVEGGLTLVGLGREGQNLEEIFRHLTTDGPGARRGRESSRPVRASMPPADVNSGNPDDQPPSAAVGG